jgi:rubrerythrin
MKSQLETSARPGTNHTGLALHPELFEEMVEGTTEFPPTSSGGSSRLAEVRISYARDGEPAATMPPVPGVEAARLPLLDKLGARLQFERTGTRLYDALISKHDAYGGYEGGPTRAQLLEIREQEHAHALLVQELIRSIGGDPTAITPCANLTATASKGLCDVVIDPRTSLVDGLETIVLAELADQESWSTLVRVADALGDASLKTRLAKPLQTELEHLIKVRAWLEAADKARTKVAGKARSPV